MTEQFASIAILKNGTKKKKKKKKKKENENDDNKENNEEAITASSVDNDSSGILPTKNRVKRSSKTSTNGGDRLDDTVTGNDVELMIAKIDETESFRRIEQWRMESGDHFALNDDKSVRCETMAVDEAVTKDRSWNDSLWKIDGYDIRLSTFCAGLLGSTVVNDNGDDIRSPISILSPTITDIKGLGSLPTPRGDYRDVPGVPSRRNGSWKSCQGARTHSHGGVDSALGDSMLSNDDLSSTTTEPGLLSTSMLLPPPYGKTVMPSCASRQHSWPDSSDWSTNEQVLSSSEAVELDTRGCKFVSLLTIVVQIRCRYVACRTRALQLYNSLYELMTWSFDNQKMTNFCFKIIILHGLNDIHEYYNVIINKFGIDSI